MFDSGSPANNRVRTALAVPLFLSLLCLATPGKAAVQTYTFEGDIPAFSGADPLGLTGAHVVIVASWDATPLTPVVNGPFAGGWQTEWPDSNTSMSVTITGSTGGGDGTFLSTANSDTWAIGDDLSFGDQLDGPQRLISVSGNAISIGGTANFLSTITTGPPTGPIQPFLYTVSDPTSVFINVLYQSLSSTATASVGTTSTGVAASTVPAASLAWKLVIAAGLLGIGAARQRRIQH